MIIVSATARESKDADKTGLPFVARVVIRVLTGYDQSGPILTDVDVKVPGATPRAAIESALLSAAAEQRIAVLKDLDLSITAVTKIPAPSLGG